MFPEICQQPRLAFHQPNRSRVSGLYVSITGASLSELSEAVSAESELEAESSPLGAAASGSSSMRGVVGPAAQSRGRRHRREHQWHSWVSVRTA